MTPAKDTSLVKEFQKVLLDDKEFLKNLLAESLQSILLNLFTRFIKAAPNRLNHNRWWHYIGSYLLSTKMYLPWITERIQRDLNGLFMTELFRGHEQGR